MPPALATALTMEYHTSGPGLISIIDDDMSVRVGLKRLFKSVGFEVADFASGEEFLNFGGLQSSDCLVLDLRMPGMDGLELQSRLISENHQIPIVFLTAHGDDQVRGKAMSDGAISFICKPFNEESLIRDVKKAVSQHRLGSHYSRLQEN